MADDPTVPVLRALLARHLDAWLPAALHRSRRATLALAVAGPHAGVAEDALRAVAVDAHRVRGRRLAVLVLADDGGDLPARLGAIEAALPADVTVHLVPGRPDRLPVALKAAGAAGAPVLTVLSDPAGAAPPPPVLRALNTGRPADALLLTAAPADAAADPNPGAGLAAAGFPLATEVDLVPADGSPARRLAFGTGSDRSLEAFKEALWAVDAAGIGYRDPADPQGRAVDPAAPVDLGPLRRELLAELDRSGPRTVTELRRHTLTATVHRSADGLAALTGLLDDGAVSRRPEDGRLGGDVLISPSSGAGSTA